ILLFFIILFGVSYFTINKIKIKTLKVKIENILNWETGSTAARIDFWSAALNAIKKRPIFGYGIETQQEVLVKYYEPGWAVHSNINVRPSRAHNIILDTWLTTGIIGVILFLTIYFYILRAIIVNIKAGREKALNYCILFSLTSYFIYLQFNFWHVTAWIYFVVYSAIVINTKQKLNIQSKLQTLTPKFLILNFSFLIIIFLALSGSIVLIRGEFTKYLNDHYWWEIRRSRMHKQYFSAIKMYEFIKKNQPRHSHYDQLFSILMTDWLKEFFSLDFRSFGEEKLKEALPQMPTYTFNEKRTKAKVLVTLGDYDINYFNQAEVIYQELVKFSPNFPLIDREYAYMLAKSGQFEHAKAQYQQTLSILPSLDVKGLNRLHEARLKSEISLNYQGLIAIYEELGDIENVNKYKKLLVELETIKN
ncbi:MAG: O-antigen ligase family protein, partial [Patescibacteria group bacterium]|nr:O-antigen ligase family protein [Patescibacteria group bacterium]